MTAKEDINAEALEIIQTPAQPDRWTAAGEQMQNKLMMKTGVMSPLNPNKEIAIPTMGIGGSVGWLGMNTIKLLTYGTVIGILGGEAKEWFTGITQTGEVRYTAALALIEVSEPFSEGSRIGEAEARKSMFAMGLAQDFQDYKVNEAIIKSKQLWGMQETGAKMNVPRLENESDQQYATRVYAAEKEQLDVQAKEKQTQQNIQTTGLPSGQPQDLGTEEQMLAIERLGETIKTTPLKDISKGVIPTYTKIKAEQTAEGRLAAMKAAQPPMQPQQPQPTAPVGMTPAEYEAWLKKYQKNPLVK